MLLADPAQKSGARWSQRLNTTIASANQYINGLATIQNLMTTAQNDLADVQAGVAQVTLDKQQLVTNFTNLDLYVGGQQSQITQTDAIVASTNLNIQNELTAIATIYSNISTLQANITSVAGVRDTIAAELAGHNSVLVTLRRSWRTSRARTSAPLTGSSMATSQCGSAAPAGPELRPARRRSTSPQIAGSTPQLRAEHSSSSKVTATLPAAGLYNGSQTVNALQVVVSGNSSAFRLCTAIEESIQQTCTISVWLRANSACTIACTVKQQSSANAVVSYGPTNFSVTTTWTRFSATYALSPQTSGQFTIVQFSGSSWPTVQLAKAQLQMGVDRAGVRGEKHPGRPHALQAILRERIRLLRRLRRRLLVRLHLPQLLRGKRVTPTLTLSSQGRRGDSWIRCQWDL